VVPSINIWAVLLATASSMVVGSIWYSQKVFGKWWMKTARVESTGKSIVYPLVATLVVSLVTSAVLAGAVSIAHNFYGGNFLLDALITAVFLWAGFTAARVVTHDAFEGRPKLLTLLTISHELVTVLVMALVIGLIGV
jgi:Protein of unknown function (DUF1761)